VNFKIYIPARYAATRLPGKLLREVAGKPLIQHVVAQALASAPREVVVATDDARIARAAEAAGAQSCMTASAHVSGSDRIAEAAALRGETPDCIIVNLQGDEPGLPPAVIAQVAALLADAPGVDIATVCEPFRCESDWRDPNQVKVLRDRHGRALYFSRAAVPHSRDREPWQSGCEYRRHVGLYAYRAAYLQHFVRLPSAPLEIREKLEQLRALYDGATIRVPDAAAPCGVGIDTPEDLARFATRLAAGGVD
jgi:3-deoxy-manno-octulosonate cytidylyltransferase (CMP-KDO synthetase)